MRARLRNAIIAGLALVATTAAVSVVLLVPGQEDSSAGASLVVDLLTEADMRIDGAAADSSTGFGLATIGDANGDRLEDMLIGVPHGADYRGHARVVFGSATGGNIDLASPTAPGFKLTGAAPGDRAGRSVASAGDVNGDGNVDYLIGAPDADHNGRSNSGSVYVVFGGSTSDVDLGNLGTRGFRIDGARAAEHAGEAVGGNGSGYGGLISAGDVNGDNLDDIVVGAPAGLSGAPGIVYVVFGKTGTGTVDLAALGSSGFKITSNGGYHFGWRVARLADINDDGLSDLAVASYNGSSAVQVVFGKADAATVDASNLGSAGFEIRFSSSGGADVARAGDVNGDRRDDILVSGPSGDAWVVFGKTGSAAIDVAALGSSGYKIAVNPAAGGFGEVGTVGDVNGDATPDHVLGAPQESLEAGGLTLRAESGSAYVVYGKASTTTIDSGNLASDQGFRIDGAAAYDWAGYQVGAAGDVNGDGAEDVLVTAIDADNNLRTDSGSVYAVYGHWLNPQVARNGLKACPPNGALSTDFAAYNVGTMFEGLAQSTFRRCEAPAGEPGRANFLAHIYGVCSVPSGQDSCEYPLEVQNWPACERHRAKYRYSTAEAYPRTDTTVRGVPAAWFDEDSRLEVYTGDATVVLFGGDRDQLVRAANALANANVSAGSPLPAPLPGALTGQLAC